jgi:HSP20 family protein
MVSGRIGGKRTGRSLQNLSRNGRGNALSHEAKEKVMNGRSLAPLTQRATFLRPDLGFLGSVQREIDRLFDDFSRGAGSVVARGSMSIAPRIEVAETDTAIEVTAEMPGFERGDVEILLDGDMLTIRGESRFESEQKEKKIRLSERVYGQFYRVLELPSAVDPSAVQATMANGVLKIVLPKSAHTEAKKIEVKEAT